METTYRSHTCGALRLADEGATVHLCGWVNSIRDQGGVLFVDLRDRYGLTQCTFRGDKDADLLAAAEKVRGEWTLRVTGTVIPRPEEARNPNMDTGDIEVEATALEVLSESETFRPSIPGRARPETSRHRGAPEVTATWTSAARGCRTDPARARADRVASMRRGISKTTASPEVETPILTRSTPGGGAGLPRARAA